MDSELQVGEIHDNNLVEKLRRPDAMSLKGKNRKIYSYINQSRRGSNFRYKDFEKTNSYHTDFGQANFSCVSLRSAHMKYCNFNGALFNGTEFVGTNLRGSSFNGATQGR